VLTIRPAGNPDAEAIARIYNDGIEERSSTFETRPRDAGEIVGWLQREDRLPVLVADQQGRVLGYWKLTGKLFPDNAASIGLVRRCGWREVGTHLRHGRLEGVWRDVLLVERLIDPHAPAPDGGAASVGA
jgi:L-amino acid N-acyltransferase YncA